VSNFFSSPIAGIIKLLYGDHKGFVTPSPIQDGQQSLGGLQVINLSFNFKIEVSTTRILIQHRLLLFV